jgi:hypothetical protein
MKTRRAPAVQLSADMSTVCKQLAGSPGGSQALLDRRNESVRHLYETDADARWAKFALD